MSDILKKLQAPFHPDRIEWRLGSCGKKQDGSFWGKALCYITQRAAFERLDEVFSTNWSIDEKYQTVGTGAVCVVTVTVKDKDTERKVSGSCQVEFDKAGDIDPFKTAASGALKRAVVSLGIGRYLYDLEEGWAVVSPTGRYQGRTKDRESFKWNPPALPAWALPEGVTAQEHKPSQHVEEEEPEYLTPTTGSNFIPNETVQISVTPFASNGSGEPLDAVIHFGKNKGNTLRSLSKKSLQWYIEEYKAEGYQGRPPRKEDLDLRAALDAISGIKKKAPAPAPVEYPPADEIPF